MRCGACMLTSLFCPAVVPLRRLVLDRTLMEAVCGGVGEVAQICVLYPLETIKVRGAVGARMLAPLFEDSTSSPASHSRRGQYKHQRGPLWL